MEFHAHCMDCAKFGKSCTDMTGTEPAGSCYVSTPRFLGVDYQKRNVMNALAVLKDYCNNTHCKNCMIRDYCAYVSCMPVPLCDIDLKEGEKE